MRAFLQCCGGLFAGVAVGFVVLFLGLPSLVGMFLAIPLKAALGDQPGLLSLGLALGFVHAIAPAVIAAVVSLRQPTRASEVLACVVLGVCAGAAVSGYLWSASAVPMNIQGPPVLHIGNFAGIVAAALGAVGLAALIRLTVAPNPSRPATPTATENRAEPTAAGNGPQTRP